MGYEIVFCKKHAIDKNECIMLFGIVLNTKVMRHFFAELTNFINQLSQNYHLGYWLLFIKKLKIESERKKSKNW